MAPESIRMVEIATNALRTTRWNITTNADFEMDGSMITKGAFLIRLHTVRLVDVIEKQRWKIAD